MRKAHLCLSLYFLRAIRLIHTVEIAFLQFLLYLQDVVAIINFSTLHFYFALATSSLHFISSFIPTISRQMANPTLFNSLHYCE